MPGTYLYPIIKAPFPYLRIIYFTSFIFLAWLALASRSHRHWFHPLIVEYGGDTIWAGMFLFFLRMIFLKPALWKLALICYILGATDECTQLYQAPWANTIRQTATGRLLFGAGFLWSDMLCYATGVLLAFIIICWLEHQKLSIIGREPLND